MVELELSRLHGELYKNMVCCLLSHLDPGLKRIDWSKRRQGSDALDS